MGNTKSIVRTLAQNPTFVLIPILAVSLIYWLSFGVGIRNINTDEARSIIAAEGILEHGYQLFPSGYVYNRGHLPHYLIAGFAKVLGLNSLSIILPSLLLALGSSWLTYRFAKDIFGRPWIGVIAAILLMTLQVQTFYATSARMYMALQFFTLLGVYSAWRGYIEGDFKFKVVALLAIGAAMLSHRQGILLALAIPGAVLVSHFLLGKKVLSLFSVINVISLIYLGLMSLLVLSYEPSNPMPTITVRGGLEPDRIGLNFSVIAWAKHVRNLELALPYSLTLLPIAALFAIKSVLGERIKHNVGLLYALLFFSASAFGVAFGLKGAVGTRTWLFLLPILALLVLVGGAYILRMLKAKIEGTANFGGIQTSLVAVLLISGLSISVTVATLVSGPFYEGESLSDFSLASFNRGPDLLGTVKLGYGIPCQSDTCSDNTRVRYDSLRNSVESDDIVISSQPVITRHYMGRVEGYIGERRFGDGTFGIYTFASDEYLGVPLTDSIEKLEDILNDERKVWIIIHPNFRIFSSQEMQDFLANNYIQVFDTDSVTAYTNCNKAPCRSN